MRDRQSEPKTKKCLKVRFYIMSLWLLFILIFLLTVNIPISFASGAKFIGWGELLGRIAGEKYIGSHISVMCICQLGLDA